MAIWKKPSGMEIETNDEPATVAYCESLGWKVKQKRKRAPVEEAAEEAVAETEIE